MKAMMTRRRLLAVTAGALTTPLGRAVAQDGLPSGNITLIVPFAAGGATDVVSRIVGEALSKRIGNPIVVENVAGAGGVTGAARVTKAKPDGSVLLMGTVSTHAINPLMAKQPAYNPQKDFTPIGMVAIVPNVLIVNKDVKATSLAELMTLLKAEPDKFTYASSGVGTPLHLSGELFKSMAGVKLQHLPYRGGGPAMNDVIGGHVPMMFDVLSGAGSFVRNGTVRALAVTTKERSSAFPDLPTMAEAGVPGYETYTWNAIFGPPEMPAATVAKLNAELQAVVADPAVRARLVELSANPKASSAEELGAHVKAEMAKWEPVVQIAGLKQQQ